MAGHENKEVWKDGAVVGIAYRTSLILGFLTEFHEEVERLKEMVNELDKAVNPHRHKEEKEGSNS